MRSHWTIAALLSSALIVGCNGRNNENPQNSDQNQAVAPANAPAAGTQTGQAAPPAPTQQPYTTGGSPTVSAQRPAAEPRATTGHAVSGTPPRTDLPSRENSRAADVISSANAVPEGRVTSRNCGTRGAGASTEAARLFPLEGRFAAGGALLYVELEGGVWFRDGAAGRGVTVSRRPVVAR